MIGTIGEFLGEGGKTTEEEDYWSQIRFRYTRAVSFVDMDIEPALRLYLTGCGFRLPGKFCCCLLLGLLLMLLLLLMIGCYLRTMILLV